MKKTAIAALLGSTVGITGVASATDFQVTVTNLTAGIHFTPLIIAAHSPSVQMFAGGTHASSQLQAIAEGGDISGMQELLGSVGADVAAGDGLLAPGASASFSISTSSAGNSVLSVAGMLLPTNDGFVGVNSAHLPTAGHSVTINALGYDAGTEANDELVGGGAPGVAGFPAPPPVVATGTGTGGQGVHTSVEGFVHIHRNVIGDLDANGGVSDINSAVHRWLNPVARVTITHLGGSDGSGGSGGIAAVEGLSSAIYSSSALEIFWQPSSSAAGYEISRDGQVQTSADVLSYFDQGLNADTEYTYSVRAFDSDGNLSDSQSISIRTNP